MPTVCNLGWGGVGSPPTAYCEAPGHTFASPAKPPNVEGTCVWGIRVDKGETPRFGCATNGMKSYANSVIKGGQKNLYTAQLRTVGGDANWTAPILPNGRTVRWGDVSCTMSADAVRCTSASSKQWFELGHSHYRFSTGAHS